MARTKKTAGKNVAAEAQAAARKAVSEAQAVARKVAAVEKAAETSKKAELRLCSLYMEKKIRLPDSVRALLKFIMHIVKIMKIPKSVV